ncbi:class I SAM-dependent DNA methyltransferase [Virgibacillus sp. W0430]|uniref:class I SAM-dependent DNA methyltransferase n=1 Tax=Virgibacillus sp. W0430 TaxID=3391580 RepID=UPI003F445E1D
MNYIQLESKGNQMTYGEMALIYDQLMTHVPYDRWVTFTQSILRKSKKKIKTIVDLGCGTGSITIELAKQGYKLIGVDSSSEMLAYAQQKASSQKVAIDWIHQDIRSLEGTMDIDVALSFCDVINYITNESDLREAFSRIYKLLKPGGIFIFDVHSIEQVENNYINNTFADVQDEIAYIWFCSEGEEQGEMFHELTFFNKKNHMYERFDETHHQKTFPLAFYLQLLEEAGFVNANFYRDFLLETENTYAPSERIFFSAEKRMG